MDIIYKILFSFFNLKHGKLNLPDSCFNLPYHLVYIYKKEGGGYGTFSL